MKVLAATTWTQGARLEDFCHAVPGELVIDLGPCSDDDPGGDCVIGRVFIGLASGHMTTTAVVVDLPLLDRRGYLRILRESIIHRSLPTAELAAMAEHWRLTAGALPAGTVVERTRGKTRVRRSISTGSISGISGS
ncbi:MAG: hypothetical protein ABWX76_03500 [Leifsonia flava]